MKGCGVGDEGCCRLFKFLRGTGEGAASSARSIEVQAKERRRQGQGQKGKEGGLDGVSTRETSQTVTESVSDRQCCVCV